MEVAILYLLMFLWFALSLFGAVAGVQTIVWACKPARHRELIGRDRCRACGYHLHGLTMGICPECGGVIEPILADKHSAAPAKPARHASIGLIAAQLAILPLGAFGIFVLLTKSADGALILVALTVAPSTFLCGLILSITRRGFVIRESSILIMASSFGCAAGLGLGWILWLAAAADPLSGGFVAFITASITPATTAIGARAAMEVIVESRSAKTRGQRAG